MYKYLILFIILFLGSVFSQSMNIHSIDGSVAQFNLSDIDSITFKVNQNLNYFLEDNFESYSVGTFPSDGGWALHWSGSGSQNQVISESYSNSATKSIQLQGTSGWAAAAKYTLSETPDIIFLEGYVRTPTNLSTSSSLADECNIRFANLSEGSWGALYAGFKFDNYAGDLICLLADSAIIIQKYTLDSWYKVRLKLDVQNNSASFWVNDELVLADFHRQLGSAGYKEIMIHAGHGSTYYYFDDIKVWYYK